MAFDASTTESRVLSLERRLYRIRQNLDDMNTWRIAGVEQQLALLWMVGQQPPCTTIITGRIVGGDAAAAPLLNSTLRVVGHASGTDYGTFAVATGTYSIPLQLDFSDTSLDFFVTGPSPRFATGPAITRSITQCATSSIANLKATPATGFHYIGAVGDSCQFPIKDTLSWTQTTLGTGTITWNGTSWSPICYELNSLVTAACAAAVATIFSVRMIETGASLNIQALFAGVGGCPIAATCPGVGNTQALAGPTTHSRTCPDASTLFTLTVTQQVDRTLFPIDLPAGPFAITFFEV